MHAFSENKQTGMLPAMERWLLRHDGDDPHEGLATIARLAQTCRTCAEGLRPLLELAKARREQQQAQTAEPIWRRAIAAIE